MKEGKKNGFDALLKARPLVQKLKDELTDLLP
jgi:hypothetical protein